MPEDLLTTAAPFPVPTPVATPATPVAAQPKVEVKPKKAKEKGAAVRAQGNKQLIDKIVTKLMNARPKGSADKAKSSAPMFDVVRSSKSILSKVQYVVKSDLDPMDDFSGALPVGRITEIFGTEGCGKSAFCIRTAIYSQNKSIYEVTEVDGVRSYRRLDPSEIDVTVVYIDNEQSVDDDGKVKIDNTELDVVLARCDTVEQMFKITDLTIDMVALEQEAENKKAKEEKRKAVIFFVIVITDTVAATSSSEDIAKEWEGKRDYPRVPQLLKDGMRTLARKINRYNVAAIYTNQVGDKFDQGGGGKAKRKSSTMHADDVQTPGGRAFRYYASLRIFMTQVSDNYRLFKGQRFSSGLLIKAYTKKNRQVKPLREIRLVLLFDGGLSNMFSILETMIFLGFAKYNDEGEIVLKFSKIGINIESAEDPSALLEAEDDDGGDKKDPKLLCRGEWPAFYEAHREQCTALYDTAMKYMFAQEGNVQEDEDEEESDGI